MDIIYVFYIPLFMSTVAFTFYCIFIKKSAESEEIKKRMGKIPKWLLICGLFLLFLAIWNFPLNL
jgi:uncharacterized membrane protein YiaA